MTSSPLLKMAPAAWLACCLLAPTANAATKPVIFNVLNATAMLPTPFLPGDNLRLDTLVTNEFGPLNQVITFTVGPGIGSFTGQAAWEVSPLASTGPRLVGVNLDLLDAANNLIASDTFAGVLGGFAHSSFAGLIGPGTYKLVATGNGVRDSSLDVTLSFVAAIPEAQTWALLLAGLGVVGLAMPGRRLSQQAA